jgi:hypothetical protein
MANKVDIKPETHEAYFETHRPHRPIGIAMTVWATLGLVIAISFLASWAKHQDQKIDAYFAFACLAGVPTLPFFIPGLYLLTRTVQTRIVVDEVTTSKRWLFFGRRRTYPLSDFSGVAWNLSALDTQDVTRGLMASFGLLGVLFGAILSQESVVGYSLTLVHHRDRKRNILLAYESDEEEIFSIKEQLASSLGLKAPPIKGDPANKPPTYTFDPGSMKKRPSPGARLIAQAKNRAEETHRNQ